MFTRSTHRVEYVDDDRIADPFAVPQEDPGIWQCLFGIVALIALALAAYLA